MSWLSNIWPFSKSNNEEILPGAELSNWEYSQLCEIYFKNEWLRHEVNHQSFQHLWNEYDDFESKNIIKQFVNKFKYLTNEEAEQLCVEAVEYMISHWGLSIENTFFIATKDAPYPDGSNILQGFMKPVLIGFNDEWQDHHLAPSLIEAADLLGKKQKFFTKRNWHIKKIVVVDDFAGTGVTARKRLKKVKELVETSRIEAEIYFFSLGRMVQAVKEIESTGCEHYSCLTFKKGTEISFSRLRRKKARNKALEMENILSETIGDRKLSDHSLGWGKCEALYNWNRLNIPNNVYPIFWWGQNKDGKKRKTMFKRMP